MKFWICGDLEAPDWVLAEIAVLSEMSQKDVLILTNTVIELLLSQNSVLIAAKLEDCDGDVLSLLEANKYTVKSKSDTMATVALLRYIVTHSVKYQVDENIVTKELEQMGLKTSHCNAIIGPFRLHRSQIQEMLISKSLHLSQIPKGKTASWRLNYTVSSKSLSNVDSPSILLNIPFSNVDAVNTEKSKKPSSNASNKDLTFAVTVEKLRALVHELRSAREVMQKFENL